MFILCGAYLFPPGSPSLPSIKSAVPIFAPHEYTSPCIDSARLWENPQETKQICALNVIASGVDDCLVKIPKPSWPCWPVPHV